MLGWVEIDLWRLLFAVWTPDVEAISGENISVFEWLDRDMYQGSWLQMNVGLSNKLSEAPVD
jgi:hypothetical protein